MVMALADPSVTSFFLKFRMRKNILRKINLKTCVSVRHKSK